MRHLRGATLLPSCSSWCPFSCFSWPWSAPSFFCEPQIISGCHCICRRIIWFNTVILLLSSAVIEIARRRLAFGEVRQFRKIWTVATALGVLFLIGQLIAWRQLVLAGFYVASNQASSFFYILTGLHGLHLLGGICALLYVAFRKFERAGVSQSVAAEVASHYWHFLDGLWIFLLALLYFSK